MAITRLPDILKGAATAPLQIAIPMRGKTVRASTPPRPTAYANTDSTASHTTSDAIAPSVAEPSVGFSTSPVVTA